MSERERERESNSRQTDALGVLKVGSSRVESKKKKKSVFLEVSKDFIYEDQFSKVDYNFEKVEIK